MAGLKELQELIHKPIILNLPDGRAFYGILTSADSDFLTIRFISEEASRTFNLKYVRDFREMNDDDINERNLNRVNINKQIEEICIEAKNGNGQRRKTNTSE